MSPQTPNSEVPFDPSDPPAFLQWEYLLASHFWGRAAFPFFTAILRLLTDQKSSLSCFWDTLQIHSRFSLIQPLIQIPLLAVFTLERFHSAWKYFFPNATLEKLLLKNNFLKMVSLVFSKAFEKSLCWVTQRRSTVLLHDVFLRKILLDSHALCVEKVSFLKISLLFKRSLSPVGVRKLLWKHSLLKRRQILVGRSKFNQRFWKTVTSHCWLKALFHLLPAFAKLLLKIS